ncbi:hypothetical protein SAMN06298212_101150 [Ruaniaceae bacterium KH17]|nr:hypothetical protein SAMN06298212_101150 [Ruaniaceae bacterium KH17]
MSANSQHAAGDGGGGPVVRVISALRFCARSQAGDGSVFVTLREVAGSMQ